MGKKFFQLLVFILLVLTGRSFSAIRIVTYNMYSGSGNYAPSYLDEKINVLLHIGEYPYNGIDRPFDILIAQELMDNHVIENYIVNGSGSVLGLNDYYGSGVYAYDTGSVVGDGYNENGMIYNTQTVQLIERANFRAPNAPRDTLRYRFRIIGYGPESDIYIYNSHMKAYDDETSKQKRSSEAQYARWSIAYGGDSLPEGTNIIYAGDFNLTGGGLEDCTMSNGDVSALGGYDNPWYYFVKQQFFAGDGAAYTSTGYGQAVDPAGITYPVNWNESSYYRSLHTWASVVPSSRLDFQLVSDELYDGKGVSFIAPGVGDCAAIESSYRSLGNDGTHTYGGRIKNSSSDRYASSVFSDLAASSDHLPLIADYQRPAILEVDVQMPSDPITVGGYAEATIEVCNAANVSAVVGADELEYQIEILSGEMLIGDVSGTDYAMGSGNSHQVILDTSSKGQQTLQICVTSSSQGCADAAYQQDFLYNVEKTINCNLFELANAWLSQPGDANWDPDCDLSDVQDDYIGMQDFAVFSQYWLF